MFNQKQVEFWSSVEANDDVANPVRFLTYTELKENLPKVAYKELLETYDCSAKDFRVMMKEQQAEVFAVLLSSFTDEQVSSLNVHGAYVFTCKKYAAVLFNRSRMDHQSFSYGVLCIEDYNGNVHVDWNEFCFD